MKFPEEYRWLNAPHGYATETGDPFGAFRIPGKQACGRSLCCIVADGQETRWEHVSVSVAHHPEECPTWEEMCAVKGLFWSHDECVVQFHPPERDYVNQHPGVLHLWRCVDAAFPMPTIECV